jgi:NifB/MoaA-like Fe-S oxidoreductase
MGAGEEAVSAVVVVVCAPPPRPPGCTTSTSGSGSSPMLERTEGGVRVESVAAGSPAMRAGIGRGDRIVSVSGKPVGDLLDLHFLTSGGRFRLRWVDSAGGTREREFRPAGAGLGIHPEPIRVRRCRNRCVFCFVHQLPRGLRRSLISGRGRPPLLPHGQYVAFSDITEKRPEDPPVPPLPLYVSIHATDTISAEDAQPSGGRYP